MPKITEMRLAGITDTARHWSEDRCKDSARHAAGCRCQRSHPLAQASLDMVRDLKLWREFGALFQKAKVADSPPAALLIMVKAAEWAEEKGLFDEDDVDW